MKYDQDQINKAMYEQQSIDCKLAEFAPDPEPEWAARFPDRALTYLFVSPRPCAALDVILEL